MSAKHTSAPRMRRMPKSGHSHTFLPEMSRGRQLLAHELTHAIRQSGKRESGLPRSAEVRREVPGTSPVAGVIARQPATPKEGWSDAGQKGLQGFNKGVITVDEKGEIHSGKKELKDLKGVWRVPIEGKERPTVALIPNTVSPAAPDTEKQVPVDVLLHLHGYGAGYRELQPGEHDYAEVLEAGQLRDVELYRMEQLLLSHVANSKRLIIAVLPQGSTKSKFGDLGKKSDDYLKDVFAKLSALKYLPEEAVPGRVIVSAHSGGGVAAMTMANQRATPSKRKEVILFDAINGPNELTTVTDWVTAQMNNEVNTLVKPDEANAAEALRTGGTRFRGYTSHKLTDKVGYGARYNDVKTHITKTIDATLKKLKIDDVKVHAAIRDQLAQNYQVIEEHGLEEYKKNDFEPHERMIGEGTYLTDALKD